MTKARPLRVLNVVADGKPGGGTTVVLGLCADIAAAGADDWAVAVLTEEQSYASSEARRLGLQVYESPFFGSPYPRSSMANLRRAVDDFAPDLIHVHGCRAALPQAVLTLLGMRAPVVYTVHGYHFLKKPALKRAVGKLAERFVAGRSRALVFVSEGDRAIAHEHGLLPGPHASSHVVYNGVDTEALDAIDDGGPKAWDIVFAARLVYQKNPVFALEVLHALGCPDVRMLIVGGGELEGECRARARELGLEARVSFAGRLDHAATLRAIASARLCLLPSRWEGLPVTPMEASYLGVPTVGSRISGTDEVVLHGHTGLLVDDFDAGDYARAIETLLAEPATLARMAQAGRERVAERFTRERCSRHYMEIYRATALLRMELAA